MLLLVGSGLVFFPSDEPEGEGLHTVVAHCTVQAGNAAVHGGETVPAGRCSCARESWRGTACVLRPVRGQGWLLRVGIAGVRRCSWRGWRLRRLWLRYTWRCTPFCPVGQCLRSTAQSRAGPTQNKGTARRSAAAGEEAGGLRIWPPAG